jgi:hypothetical protein
MQKKIIIAVIILLVLVTSFVVLYYYFRGKTTEENANQANTNEVANQNQSLIQNLNQNANVSTENSDQATIRSIALAYTERYGSFSNQNDFENLEDLKIWMSKSLQKPTDAYIAGERAKNANTSVYHGYTTSALSAKIDSITNDKATVTVSARRQEVDDNTNQSKTYFQDLVLKFIKEDDAWKVNEANWQNIK